MIRCSENLEGISKSEKVSFQMVRERNYALTNSGSEFQRVGTPSEKTSTPAWVLTLGTDSKWKPYDWTTLDLDARESIENRYEVSPEERLY